MGEGGIFIIVGINLLYLFDGLVALGISGDEDAPCKTTALGNEEYASIIARTQLLHRLVDLQQVLMGECLINRDIIVAP